MPKRKRNTSSTIVYAIPLITGFIALFTVLIQHIITPKPKPPAPVFPKEIVFEDTRYLCPATESDRLMQLIRTKSPDAKSSLNAVCDAVTKVFYRCNGKKTIIAYYDIQKKRVSVFLNDGRYLLLPQAMAASGIRYTNTDESIVFWSKGETAFVTEGNATTFDQCVEAGI